MGIRHAKPAEVFNLTALDPPRPGARTTALVKTSLLEVIHMVIPKGHEIPKHSVEGEITVQCLAGRITFTAASTAQEMTAGHWLYLLGNEPHSLTGIEDSSVLVTILLHARKSSQEETV